MKLLKIAVILFLSLLAVAGGVFFRLREKKTAVTPSIMPTVVIEDSLRTLQFEGINRWLSSLPTHLQDDLDEARRIFSLNYQEPWPTPPYFSDTSCGFYILDGIFTRLTSSERQEFADAYNIIFEEGITRSANNLFGAEQKFRPTWAARAVRDVMTQRLTNDLTLEKKDAHQKYLAQYRYTSAVIESPTAKDCEFIPGIPEMLVR